MWIFISRRCLAYVRRNSNVLKYRRRVYAVTVDQQNSEVMYILNSNGPTHTSVDSTFGEKESDRLFGSRNKTSQWRKAEDISRFDRVVEKAMVHAGKSTDSEPKTSEKRKSMASVITDNANAVAPEERKDEQR